jgi:hypothetical protein
MPAILLGLGAAVYLYDSPEYAPQRQPAITWLLGENPEAQSLFPKINFFS